jgi:hypothetical protein
MLVPLSLSFIRKYLEIKYKVSNCDPPTEIFVRAGELDQVVATERLGIIYFFMK